MPVALAYVLLVLAGVYAAAGAIFALAFIVRGVSRLDPAAAAGSAGFRAVIVPGVIALWPLLLHRWWAGQTAPPEERNPHRAASRRRGAGP